MILFSQGRRTKIRIKIIFSPKHVLLQSLSRAVGSQRSVEFLFRGIGVLYIKDNRVKTRFFKDFVNVIDSTGGLLNLMEKVKLFSVFVCIFT